MNRAVSRGLLLRACQPLRSGPHLAAPSVVPRAVQGIVVRSFAVTAAEQAHREDVHAKYAALGVHGSTQVQGGGGGSGNVYSSSDDVLDELTSLHEVIMSANWADYLFLVYNAPFWESEIDRLSLLAQSSGATSKKLAEVKDMMDVLYQCEDVRDHINELAELATRASGFMGTGWKAGEKVENMSEHAEHCAKAYEALLAAHPSFKPKIEQTVGHGLAVLRQKHKFKWGTMHRYFF